MNWRASNNNSFINVQHFWLKALRFSVSLLILLKWCLLEIVLFKSEGRTHHNYLIIFFTQSSKWYWNSCMLLATYTVANNIIVQPYCSPRIWTRVWGHCFKPHVEVVIRTWSVEMIHHTLQILPSFLKYIDGKKDCCMLFVWRTALPLVWFSGIYVSSKRLALSAVTCRPSQLCVLVQCKQIEACPASNNDENFSISALVLQFGYLFIYLWKVFEHPSFPHNLSWKYKLDNFFISAPLWH